MLGRLRWWLPVCYALALPSRVQELALSPECAKCSGHGHCLSSGACACSVSQSADESNAPPSATWMFSCAHRHQRPHLGALIV